MPVLRDVLIDNDDIVMPQLRIRLFRRGRVYRKMRDVSDKSMKHFPMICHMPIAELSAKPDSRNAFQLAGDVCQSPGNRSRKSDLLGFLPDRYIVIGPELNDQTGHPKIGEDGSAGSLEIAGKVSSFVRVIHAAGLHDAADDLAAT